MNFIEDYLIYTSGNEVPKIYHEWSAISLLASIVGRHVWIDQGIFTLYPNLYIIFVGDPANGKSTAMNIAKKLAREFKIPIAPSSITKERLTQFMGENESECKRDFKFEGKVVPYTHMNIYANELLTLLGTVPLEMVKLLTDIYDEPDEFKVDTKNKGVDIIKGPFVNMLGCMTPEITSSLIKQSIINGGFNRRCIFLFRNRLDKPVAIPVITPAQWTSRERCILRGCEIQQLKGPFEWNPDAKKYFVDWYENTHFPFLQSQVESATRGYYRSKDAMLLKIATLIHLSHNNDLQLTTLAIKKSMQLLADMEKTLHRVFEGAGRNIQSGMAAQVITMLEQSPGQTMEEKNLYTIMFDAGDRDEISKVLYQLISTDRVVKTINKENTTYTIAR